MNIYETERLLAEYLLFHYAAPEEILPYKFGPHGALDYAVRCVSECVRPPGPDARALDLGCAVGRSSFELARICGAVLGIDYSKSFIQAAERLRAGGELATFRVDEGELTTSLTVQVPLGIPRDRVHFEVGDAQNLRQDLGQFDIVLMANLIDRLREPRRCLSQLPGLVKPGGQLVITSPYTWLPEFTDRQQWLGGFADEHGRVETLAGLRIALEPEFVLEQTKDLPFLIREHGRKFQWSVAQASIWARK